MLPFRKALDLSGNNVVNCFTIQVEKMDSILLLGYLAIAILLARLISIIKLDTIKDPNKNRLLKFIFGAYAFEVMFPVLRSGRTNYESKWIRVASAQLVLFYLLTFAMIILIWIKYNTV